jgi:site-specific DNA-methyltransferase (adenine-specific)
MQEGNRQIDSRDSRILASEVLVEDRLRKSYDGIDELCNSIKELGIIQPIILTRANKLIAGGRRLLALKRLGVSELIHTIHFVYNDEVDEYRLRAMELEENLRRKNLTWTEEIVAKKQLLETYQRVYGAARTGYVSRSDIIGLTSPGFGVNKLANLLGESNAQTSKDLELARLVEAVPELAKAETKEAARRQAGLAMTVAGALIQQKLNPPKTDAKWVLYEGDFQQNASNIADSTVDLVLVDPPYGEGTSGMGPNSKELLAGPFGDEGRHWDDLVAPLVMESFRVLRLDKFAAFFFGFTFYGSLVTMARSAGFEVDITPLIWVKNTVINTDPYRRYGRSYEPILIARKGQPKLMRPAQRDVITVQNVITKGTNEQKLYQAQKPVELMEKLVLDLSVPGGTVVDWCAGSGSTGVAALRMGRRAILFEKDVVACNIIRSRLGAL